MKQFSGNLLTCLAIIIQVIFSHEILADVEKGFLLVDISVLLSTRMG